MPVNTTHPEYDSACSRWHLIRSIINNDAKKWIRTVDIQDNIRSSQYKEDAILTNFTNLTKVGLTGLIFKKPPEITLPESLSYLFDDVTGSGINIWQFSQYVAGELIQVGRFGVLVDYPKLDKFNTGQAYLKPYAAEHVINWKTKVVGNKCVLGLVVLCEEVLKESDDMFSQEKITQHRVLRLNENNVYEQLLYDENHDIIDYTVPLNASGKPFNYIPFQFIGSENNDWVVDWQPLYDLAVLNLGHYRNSADYEESIFICGQPYIVVNVGEYTSQEQFNSDNPDGLQFGSRKGLIVSGSGKAELLQANPNQLADQAMQRKEEQAAAIGARLIAPPGGRETAEAAKIRFGSQNSALYTLTSNISWGIENALRWVADFMGADVNEVSYRLNDQFYDETADPNLLAQMWLGLDRGVWAKDDVREYARKTGIVGSHRSNDDLDADSENITSDNMQEYSEDISEDNS